MNSPKYQTIKFIIDNSTTDLYTQVETALNYVSPDCSRDEWFKLLCAIHDALNENGYELAKSWSKQSTKYHEGNFDNTWTHQIGKSTGITKGYLFKLAYDNGMPKPKRLPIPQQPNSTITQQWARCTPYNNHPYMVKKGLNGKLNGYEQIIRIGNDSTGRFIADPIFNLSTGELVGFNRIYDEGDNKKFATGTQKKGNAGIVPNWESLKNTETVCITEGMADAINIYNEFDKPVCIAENASNIDDVVTILRKLYPTLIIIICADNDSDNTKYNTGIVAAQKAKGNDELCFIALPPFGKDFTESVQNGYDIKEVLNNAINSTAPIKSEPETPAEIYKPMVIINGTSLSEERTPACINALVKKNRSNPYLFSKDNKLVRIELSKDNEGIHSLNIKEIDVKTLLHELDRAVRFVRVKEQGEMSKANPPKIIAEDILAFPNFPDFPILKKVTTAPCVTHGEKIITQKGYDKDSGIYYHQHQKLVIPDTTPTAKNVKNAKTLIISELLVDFPFDSEASQANVIAAFILPFCRDLIKGCTPLHFITAPAPGTGKTLLAITISNVFNEFVQVSTSPKGNNPNDVEEEWRKKITTRLASMPSHVIFDNVSGYFDSINLASVLTRTSWNDRLLGNNTEITVNNYAVWLATGNNAELSTDIARRSIEIRLDANMEKPNERSNFKHYNIEKWAKENRGKLIAAVLTLIRNWLVQGKPKPTNTPQMGSFEEYRNVIGGILQCADIQGFLQNYKESQERVDSNTLMFQAFFDAWHNGIEVKVAGLTKTVGKFTDKPQYVSELHEVAREVGMFDNFLNGKDLKSETSKLGRWLAKNVGKVYGQYKLTVSEQRGRNAYKLLKISNK